MRLELNRRPLVMQRIDEARMLSQAAQAERQTAFHIVYGGAFDPPHAGHRDCARLALAAFPHARLLVVPGFLVAGAYGRHKTATADYLQRVEMCRLAFAGMERLDVSLIERELSQREGAVPAPNYTVNTLLEMQARNSEPLILLIGQDQLAGFHAWHEPLNILRLASLAIVERPSLLGEADPKSLQELTRDMAKELGLHLSWESTPDSNGLARAKDETNGATVYAIGRSAWPAASIELRDSLAAGRPAPEGWLCPAVDSYIRARSLYGT